MKSCASLMWFYGSLNNVAALRLSVATNAWNSSTSLYPSSQVSNPAEGHLRERIQSYHLSITAFILM